MRCTYLTSLDLSSAVASAARLSGVSAALTSAGCEVTVLAPTAAGRGGAEDSGGATVVGYGPGARNRAHTRQLIYDDAAAAALESQAGDVVLVYGTSSGLLRAAYRHAHRRGIPVVLDVVEWYDSAHLPGGRFGPFALANADSMRRLSQQADRVVTISSRLARHYGSAGLQTHTVPPLFDAALRAGLPSLEGGRQDGELRLCFVGSMGGKDARSVLHTIAALDRLGARGRQVRFHVVGPTPAEVAAGLGGAPPPNVVVEGRLARADALRTVARCHFSVLQRPAGARYADAGFPSKVAESLVLGTPIIGNLTSDLARHLVDGHNAIVLAGDTVDDLTAGLVRALEEPLRWDRTRIRARADADFAPAAHGPGLAEFLSRPRRPR